MNILENLPDEILLLILSHLNKKDLSTMTLICKTFQHLANDNILWRGHLKSDLNRLLKKSEKTNCKLKLIKFWNEKKEKNNGNGIEQKGCFSQMISYATSFFSAEKKEKKNKRSTSKTTSYDSGYYNHDHDFYIESKYSYAKRNYCRRY